MKNNDKDCIVKGIVVNLETQELKVRLGILNYLKGKQIDVDIIRRDINPSSIKDIIVSNGGVCEDGDASCGMIETEVNKCLKNISKSDSEYNIYYEHEEVGFDCVESNLIFKGESIINSPFTSFNSIYVGAYDIYKKGEIQNIQKLYNEVINGNTPMEFVMGVATSATLLSYLNLNYDMNMNNPIIHLVAKSTTGKSTAALLASSFGSNPNSHKGCFLSFLSTENALVKRIGGNKGYPYVMDEFSTAGNSTDITSLIYILANGFSKDRCNAGGNGLQDKHRFMCSIITNGEKSIRKKCKNNLGIDVRLFEFENILWTRNAEESNRIKKMVSQNYGLLTPAIAQELLYNGDYWYKEFTRNITSVENKIKKDEIYLTISSRLTDYVALFLTSCSLINKVLDVSISMEEMKEFIYKNIILKAADNSNLGKRVYEVIKSFVALNPDKIMDVINLPFGGTFPKLESEQVGFITTANKPRKIGNEEYDRYLLIPVEKMNDLLESKGFDVSVAMHDLKEAGYCTSKDSKRVTHEMDIWGNRTRVYKIWVKGANWDFDSCEDDSDMY